MLVSVIFATTSSTCTGQTATSSVIFMSGNGVSRFNGFALVAYTIFPAPSAHLKHIYSPLCDSVVMRMFDPLVYEVPGKSVPSHIASAEYAYSLTVRFVSVTRATTVSHETGPASTSLIIEMLGFVTSILRGFAEARYPVFHVLSRALKHT